MEQHQEVLDNANKQLKEMWTNKQWSNLNEVKVTKFTDYNFLLGVEELPSLAIWLIIALFKMNFLPVPTSLIGFGVFLIIYTFANAKSLLKSIKAAITLKDAMTIVAKETVFFLCITSLGQIAISEFIEIPSIFSHGLYAILVVKMSLIQDMQLQYQLSQKITIAGDGWSLNRLVMMNPKAVALHTYAKQIPDLLKSK